MDINAVKEELVAEAISEAWGLVVWVYHYFAEELIYDVESKFFEYSVYLWVAKNLLAEETKSIPRIACLAGEYSLYPIKFIRPRMEDTNTSFPFTPSATMRRVASYWCGMIVEIEQNDKGCMHEFFNNIHT